MASSSKTAALMEGRLRAARSGGATQVKIEPSTSRGRNTAGLGAEAAARAAEANFGSFAEIRRETRLITPLATAIQSGLRTVLGTVMPQNDLVSASMRSFAVVPVAEEEIEPQPHARLNPLPLSHTLSVHLAHPLDRPCACAARDARRRCKVRRSVHRDRFHVPVHQGRALGLHERGRHLPSRSGRGLRR